MRIPLDLVHILRKYVPLRPSDCSHGKAMRQSASASHCFPPPLYIRPKSAPLVHQLSSFAQRTKLAGFADSAHSVDKTQSQTRLSSFALCTKLAAVR